MSYKNIHQNKDSATIPLQYFDFYSNSDIKKNDFRVLLYLMGKLDGDYFSKIKFRRMADELDLGVQDAKRSVANLIEAGIVEFGHNKLGEEGYSFANVASY